MQNDKEIVKDGLDSFLSSGDTKTEQVSNDAQIISSKTGLVERIEKKLITQDGRQLLTEIKF